MELIKAEYPSDLIKELSSLKNDKHGIIAYGEIENYHDYRFRAWLHDKTGISSRLIFYSPSRGFLEGKAVEIEGFEFQSNHDLVREKYLHQFVKTNYDAYHKKFDLTGNNGNFIHSEWNKVKSYEESKKELEEILIFTGKENHSEISSYFLPKNKEFIELHQLSGELYGYSSADEIYHIVSAYAEMGLERIEKRINGKLK